MRKLCILFRFKCIFDKCLPHPFIGNTFAENTVQFFPSDIFQSQIQLVLTKIPLLIKQKWLCRSFSVYKIKMLKSVHIKSSSLIFVFNLSLGGQHIKCIDQALLFCVKNGVAVLGDGDYYQGINLF